ncbi:MAG: VOC family protein [Ruminococcus sp.]|jgi:predicted enzyme related to lactoylglutathione lyase|nr:VOC family protein [Ruminococcus sp.]
MTAQFTDLCLISKDVLNLVNFYEKLFDVNASEKSEYHSSVNIGGLSLTIDAADIADGDSVFSYVNCKSSDNTIICFNVDDVDTEYTRVLALGAVTLNEPTTHTWGARSFQFRDPDGNILNFRTISKGAK